VSNKPVKAVVIIVAIALTMPGLGQDASQKPLLRDGFTFGGVDGSLAEKDGRWFFAPESPISDGRAEVKAGQSLELLSSATLEKMDADAKQRVDMRCRLWGRITTHKEKNFVFPVYYLPLTKKPQPQAQPQPQTQINAPDDILAIPETVVAKAQTDRAFVTVQPGKPLELKVDSVLTDRTGLLVQDGTGQYKLELDGVGQGLGRTTFHLLACEALERACREQASQPDKIRFRVAGIFTRYRGKDYLLLQRATRVYTHGNFGL